MIARLYTWLRLIYNAAIFWSIGEIPENYHWKAAFLWEELGNYQRSSEHCRRFLLLSNNVEIRGLLGYCHCQLAEWSDARRVLSTINNIWIDLSFALCLAEANINLGYVDDARRILAVAYVNNGRDYGHIARWISVLEDQIAAGSDNEVGLIFDANLQL